MVCKRIYYLMAVRNLIYPPNADLRQRWVGCHNASYKNFRMVKDGCPLGCTKKPLYAFVGLFHCNFFQAF